MFYGYFAFWSLSLLGVCLALLGSLLSRFKLSVDFTLCAVSILPSRLPRALPHVWGALLAPSDILKNLITLLRSYLRF